MIKPHVDQIRPLFISRKGINPIIDLVTVLHLLFIFKSVKPDFSIFFSIKPVIYGGLVARILGKKSIVMITGLGTVFIKTGLLTKIVEALYRTSIKKSWAIIFQNADDRRLFLDRGLAIEKNCLLSPGSGVDLQKFEFKKLEERKNFNILMVARLLRDKGTEELVKATRRIKKKYPFVRVQLLGPVAAENRTAVSKSELAAWVQEGVVEHLGESDDVRPFLYDADCVVLPSYREGTPKSLLEAAATGRPIVTTDVPGCREVVEHQFNGLLCEPRNDVDLEKKIEEIILSSIGNRQKMGRNGRKKMEAQFSQDIVCDVFLKAIRG